MSIQNISNFLGDYSFLKKAFEKFVRFSGPEVGDYKSSCRDKDADRWLVCDGRSISRHLYPELFNLIGTTFGSDDDETFKLPDFRGRVMGTVGQGSLLTNRHMGDAVGSETHTLSQSEMPQHSHTGTTDSSGLHSHATNATGGGSPGLVVIDGTGTPGSIDNNANEINTTKTIGLSVDSAGNHVHTFTTNVTGGGAAHNNMQPTLFAGNILIFSGYA